MTCRDVECHSFGQYLNASSLSTGKFLLLLFVVNLSYVTEIWKLPKMYSTEQHQKTGRKGGRQRGGGKCQGSFAKQIENYPFV